MHRYLALLMMWLIVSGCTPYRNSEANTSYSRTGRTDSTHRPAPAPRTEQGWRENAAPTTHAEPHHSNGNAGAASLLQQASVARQQGELGKAQSLAERAQAIEPRSGYSYLELARIYQAKGDPSRAKQMALRGLSYSSGDAGLQAALQAISSASPSP